MNNLFKIHKNDNVAVALKPLEKGYKENGITVLENIPFGHKVLLEDLSPEMILYQQPILQQVVRI